MVLIQSFRERMPRRSCSRKPSFRMRAIVALVEIHRDAPCIDTSVIIETGDGGGQFAPAVSYGAKLFDRSFATRFRVSIRRKSSHGAVCLDSYSIYRWHMRRIQQGKSFETVGKKLLRQALLHCTNDIGLMAEFVRLAGQKIMRVVHLAHTDVHNHSMCSSSINSTKVCLGFLISSF
jgi:hypothetical protein